MKCLKCGAVTAPNSAQDDRFLGLSTKSKINSKNKSKFKNKSNHRSFDFTALRSG